MDKLNICLINDSFPPAIDGVANAVTNYAKIIQNGLGNSTVATRMTPCSIFRCCAIRAST